MTEPRVEVDEFLQARLAEEQAAAEAAVPSPWVIQPTTSVVLGHPNMVDIVRRVDATYLSVAADHEGFGACSRSEAAHITRWEPGRVLAEVEAKRRIIDRYRRASDQADHGDPDFRDT